MVKAYPQPSQKHEETVCCAGVAEETREFLRLFPIRYRRLPRADRFSRFDLVEMAVTKASDPRPESYRVDEGSIHLLKKGSRLSDESKVRLWEPFIASSLEALMEDNRSSGRSLGIIRPDPGSLKFVVKELARTNAADQEVANMLYEQASLLEDPLKPLEKPRYGFSYHYTCAGQPHKHQIHDWEVQAAFISYRRRYKTEEKALAMMKQEYGDNIPKQNLHFIMGTMMAHPRTFIVIGMLRSRLDPEKMRMQSELF